MKNEELTYKEHEHDCGCGHEHEHEDSCGCGHEHEDSCGCEHEHIHEEEKETPANHVTKVYTMENLGCANCAAKMEERINHLESVSWATITFATKQLRITAENPDELRKEIEDICNQIEDGIRIVEKKEEKSIEEPDTENRKNLICILAGAAVLLGAVIVNKMQGGEEYTLPYLIAFVVAYLILGGEIVVTAVKNLFKGNPFDENFLMSIATIGAFVIGEYPEAVGVMLFFRIGEFFEDVAVERSRSQIMDAIDLRPEVVNLVTGEEVSVIPAKEAKPGDVVYYPGHYAMYAGNGQIVHAYNSRAGICVSSVHAPGRILTIRRFVE